MKRFKLKYSFIAVISFAFCGFFSAYPAQNECTVTDDEEYAVLAAVLFPEERNNTKKTDINNATRLNGFHGDHYAITNKSMESKISKETDKFLMDDFNRKNKQSCTFQTEKLLARFPQGKTVRFRNSAEPRGEPGLVSGEITYLSRPGFNKSRMESVVEVSIQADPEMGVGYRVYLKKLAQTGKWIITGADQTRIY
jgi:hypothetical protein